MRQPVQVHIFLFRKNTSGEYEYAVFQRTDAAYCWQGVCGGLEEDETLPEGARRELYEEAGIEGAYPLYPLESISYLPDLVFDHTERKFWGKEIVVIPMYFFAMPYTGEIRLSEEHTAVEWLCYEQAYQKIYYMDQKIALYELKEKLLRGNLQ